ncbi:hypothetical protein ES703_78579 [subsurface metagenome]
MRRVVVTGAVVIHILEAIVYVMLHGIMVTQGEIRIE